MGGARDDLSFVATVTASDAGDGKSSVSSVAVPFRIVSEASNAFAPRFDFDLYEVSVSELASPGTVVARVNAVDEDAGDGGEVDYAVSGI